MTRREGFSRNGVCGLATVSAAAMAPIIALTAEASLDGRHGPAGTAQVPPGTCGTAGPAS